MRRRRQRNPLLMRIIVISIIVHIIALPILAHFGAFKKIQQHFVEVTAVRLPPPPAEPDKKAPETKKKTPKPRAIAHQPKKGASSTSHAHSSARHSTVN